MYKVLVTFKSNWADEFDVEGFKIFEKEEWEDLVEEMHTEVEFPHECHFGTNEWIDFESPEEYLACCKIQELTYLEATVIEQKIGSEHGTFLFPYL